MCFLFPPKGQGRITIPNRGGQSHLLPELCSAKIRHKLGCLGNTQKGLPQHRGPRDHKQGKDSRAFSIGVRDLGSRLGTWLLPKLILAQTVDFSTQLPLTSTVTTLNIAALSGQTFQLDIPSVILNAVSIQL